MFLSSGNNRTFEVTWNCPVHSLPDNFYREYYAYLLKVTHDLLYQLNS